MIIRYMKSNKKPQTKNHIKNISQTLALGLGIFIVSNTTNALNDIDPNDPYRHMYEHLTEVGIIFTPDGNFYPHNYMTRAEALTVAMRAGGRGATEYDGDPGFSDVDPNEWYAPIVDAALNQKIINNNPNFRPTQSVTKAEFLAFLFRATNVDFGPYFTRKRGVATDVPQDSWFAPHFAYAKQFQIAHLPADDLYFPHKYLSRKEIGIMTYRQLKIHHGDNTTKKFVELQGQIQRFLSLIRDQKHNEAEFYLHRILEINDEIVRTKNGSDALAARALSNAMTHLTDSLRFMRYERTLGALENLMLALKQAERASKLSQTLKPFADELGSVVREMLLQVTDSSYMASR